MTTMAERTLEGAAATLAALEAEQSEVEARTTAARRAGDSKLWMTLMSRSEQLPAEIVAARCELLPLLIDHAWTVVDELHAAELAADVQVAAARAEIVATEAGVRADIAALKMDGRGTFAEIERLKAVNAIEARVGEKRVAANEALSRRRAAQEATAAALYQVDVAEAELFALTGEPPAGGDGLRALPRVLTQGFHFSPMDLAVSIPGEQRFWAVGDRPPRWLAYLLGEHLFLPVDDDPVTAAGDGEVQPPAVYRQSLTEAQFERHLAAAKRQHDHDQGEFR